MHRVSSGDRSRPSQSVPLISIVLPVYNAAPFLPACLDSITAQTFRDIEIIAVDGGSKDGSECILDERMRSERRLTVLHQGRIGPGNARNLGAAKATGEYLWFVDADDVVADECLPEIAQSLKVASPDVLLVGYESVLRSGGVEAGPVAALQAGTAQTTFTLADCPQALSISMASWNKIVRREFFSRKGAAFASDWPHEDVPVSWLLLHEAQRLSFLEQLCYRYTKDTPGSAMASGDPRRHFKIFGAWRPLLEDARKRAQTGDPLVPDYVYRALFERAIGHYSTLLDKGWGIGPIGTDGYVALGDRQQFFGLMHEDFDRFAPAGYQCDLGPRGLKFRLIAGNHYWLYAALSPLNKCRVRLRTAVRRLSGAGWAPRKPSVIKKQTLVTEPESGDHPIQVP